MRKNFLGALLVIIGLATYTYAQEAQRLERGLNIIRGNLTPSAASIGATTITVTLGATAAVADEYTDGFAFIDTTPGLGYAYQITSHPAANASATLVVTLKRSDAVVVALTTSSRVTLGPNPYRGVIQAPVTTLTNVVVGVAVYVISDTEFGWIQTGGPAPVLITGTPAVSVPVASPSGTAGAVEVAPDDGTQQNIGFMMVTGQSGLVMPVLLTID